MKVNIAEFNTIFASYRLCGNCAHVAKQLFRVMLIGSRLTSPASSIRSGVAWDRLQFGILLTCNNQVEWNILVKLSSVPTTEMSSEKSFVVGEHKERISSSLFTPNPKNSALPSNKTSLYASIQGSRKLSLCAFLNLQVYRILDCFDSILQNRTSSPRVEIGETPGISITHSCVRST